MKENLKPCVYKHTKSVKGRCGTFCRTVRRVIECSEVKCHKARSRSESESEEGVELHLIDPKPGDLPMSRLKLP